MSMNSLLYFDKCIQHIKIKIKSHEMPIFRWLFQIHAWVLNEYIYVMCYEEKHECNFIISLNAHGHLHWLCQGNQAQININCIVIAEKW